MAGTKQDFLNYLRDNGDASLSKEEIIHEYGVSVQTAYNWMSSPYVMAVIPSTSQKRVEYNWSYHDRILTKQTEDRGPKRSVNAQIREAAKSLSPSGSVPTADHSSCIKKDSNNTDITLKTIIERAVENPEGISVKGLLAAIVSGKVAPAQIKTTAVQLWECVDYIEKHPNEFKD